MKHDVIIYDIEHDKQSRRMFHNEEAAQRYANDLKRIFLNRPNPAYVFIDVVPA